MSGIGGTGGIGSGARGPSPSERGVERPAVEARSPATIAAEARMREARAQMSGRAPAADRARSDDRAVAQRLDDRAVSARIDDRSAATGAAERAQRLRSDEMAGSAQRVDERRSAAARGAESRQDWRAGRRNGIPDSAMAVPAADNLRSRMVIEAARAADAMTEAAAQRALREYIAG